MSPETLNLKEAVDALRLETIYLKDGEVFTNESFSPSIDDATSLVRETFQGTSRVITQVHEGEGGNTFWSYRFFYSAGVRLVSEGEESTSDHEVCVEIKATYDALYFSEVEVSEEAIKEFARSNVGFNTWPFWREFVQNSCNRIGLSPSIPIPLYRKNRDPFDVEDNE